MPPGIYTCITWSNLELKGLLEDEESRVVFQRAKRHLGLHPFHLNDLNRAIREILDSTVNTYDFELQGLVLGYKKPKLVSPLGAILHDSHFIHVDIEADFYIFKPQIGSILKGIANKKASNHLGLLVHKAFNVSIPKSEECDEWLGDYVFVGQEVKFNVTQMDFKGKLPFITGELIDDGLPHLTYDEEALDAKSNEENINDKSIINDIEIETRTKRSKKSRIIDSSDENSDNDNKNKVFSENQTKNEINEKLDKQSTKVSNLKRKIVISSSEETSDDESRKIVAKKSKKRRRVSSDTSESEEETIDKRKNNVSPKKPLKVYETPDTSLESQESIERKPKIQSIEIQKSQKKKRSKESENTETIVKTKLSVKYGNKKSTENGNLDKSLEAEDNIVEKLVINKSLQVEKLTKHKEKKSPVKRSKENENSDEIVEPQSSGKIKKKKLAANGNLDISSEAEIDEKPEINKSLIVEKSTRHKEKKSPTKRSKENENLDKIVKPQSSEKIKKKKLPANGNLDISSEAEDEIDEKPEINKSLTIEKSSKHKEKKLIEAQSTNNLESPKKRSKKNRILDTDDEETTEIEIKDENRVKNKKKSKNKREESDKLIVNEEDVDKNLNNTFEFIKPEIKGENKKKRQKNIVENEKTTSEQSTSEFFQDIRIKSEPDPSDVEDIVEKSDKKKKKRIKEEGKRRKNNEDKTFNDLGIKCEPDASDIEDTKPGKKKIKRKNRDKDLFDGVKIKTEPDASHVEDSKPKKKTIFTE